MKKGLALLALLFASYGHAATAWIVSCTPFSGGNGANKVWICYYNLTATNGDWTRFVYVNWANAATTAQITSAVGTAIISDAATLSVTLAGTDVKGG